MRQCKITIRFLVTATTLVIVTALWFHGMLNSVILNPEFLEPSSVLSRADEQSERMLAEAYWLRYPDIREDQAYGENGTMGIFGPQAHFEQHGRNEGRIFAPVMVPKDLLLEQKLAEAYWKRYPELENSVIWGKKSALGILGPRDHYLYRGKPAGWKWGTEASEDTPAH